MEYTARYEGAGGVDLEVTVRTKNLITHSLLDGETAVAVRQRAHHTAARIGHLAERRAGTRPALDPLAEVLNGQPDSEGK